MSDFWERLKQRKLVQWALAYVAGAFALLQGIDIVAQQFGWPEGLQRGITLALILGFFVTLVLAWYHGERGAQKVGGSELLVLALLLAVGGGLMWRFAGAPVAPKPEGEGPVAPAAASATPVVPAKSIAVLPFENLSADKDNEYFVAGMQDLILTKLADIGEIKVISRTSTLKYRSRPENLKQIGAELGVAHVLEGSVQRQGNAVLVNVQLIDTATDAHLWAESYQRTLDNVFGVEGEVAGKVADALKARLSPAATTRLATSLSSNPEADDLYLRAEYFSHRGDTDFDTAQYKQAIALYRQAISKAPDFALALSRLSYTESALAWFGGGGEDVAQLVADAQARAETASKLAPKLPEARLAMGYSHYYGEGEYDAALADFAAVLQLRPNDAKAFAAQGYVLRRQGHFDAGIDSLTRAQALDPRNSELGLALGETLMMAARYPEAEAALQRALALDPANRQAKFRLAWEILVSRGDVTGALEMARGDEPRMQLMRVYLLSLQRNYRQALELLNAVPDTPDNFYQSTGGPKTLQQAELYRSMGDAVRAHGLYAKSLPLARDYLNTDTDIPIKAVPVWILIARVQADLDHDDEAMAALEKAQDLLARVRDYTDGPYMIELMAAGYAKAGRADLAVPMLEKAFATPGIGLNYSPVMLWLDPDWDPIRDDPRFQSLLRKYADRKPAGLQG
jgi:TolB-like protein/Tfp pilus assembly protein PilF